MFIIHDKVFYPYLSVRIVANPCKANLLLDIISPETTGGITCFGSRTTDNMMHFTMPVQLQIMFMAGCINHIGLVFDDGKQGIFIPLKFCVGYILWRNTQFTGNGINRPDKRQRNIEIIPDETQGKEMIQQVVVAAVISVTDHRMVCDDQDMFVRIGTHHCLQPDHKISLVCYQAAILRCLGDLIGMDPPFRIKCNDYNVLIYLYDFRPCTSIVRAKYIGPVEVILYKIFLVACMCQSIRPAIIPVMIPWNE